MFVSTDWIKDYVDLSGINTDELIKNLLLVQLKLKAMKNRINSYKR